MGKLKQGKMGLPTQSKDGMEKSLRTEKVARGKEGHSVLSPHFMLNNACRIAHLMDGTASPNKQFTKTLLNIHPGYSTEGGSFREALAE